MKMYYAEISYGEHISLTALEVKETPKLYVIKSRRDIIGSCFDTNIKKDSEHIFKNVDDAMVYIGKEVKEEVDKAQAKIAKLQEQETNLRAAYEKSKAAKGAS